tara:strand:- start:1132 stop:1281 length:150 start_codon:yes stop_codon:yes gene_type:complete
MLDSLPASPTINERDEIEACSFGKVFMVVLIPLLSVLGHYIYAVNKYMG